MYFYGNHTAYSIFNYLSNSENRMQIGQILTEIWADIQKLLKKSLPRKINYATELRYGKLNYAFNWF
jgi:hypothetical protein